MRLTLRDSFFGERPGRRSKVILIKRGNLKFGEKLVNEATVRKTKVISLKGNDHFLNDEGGKVDRTVVSNAIKDKTLFLIYFGAVGGHNDVGINNEIE